MADTIKEEDVGQTVYTSPTTSVTLNAAFATPKGKKRTKKEPVDDGTPSKKPKNGPTTAIPISFAELSAADKIMWDWKEAEKSWPEINVQWKVLTGIKPGKSTLSSRLLRVKAAIARVDDEDVEVLKASIEKARSDADDQKKVLENTLWSKVSENMVASGAKKYEAGTLEKEAKRLLE